MRSLQRPDLVKCNKSLKTNNINISVVKVLNQIRCGGETTCPSFRSHRRPIAGVSGVLGRTGPPAGEPPSRSTAAGRAAACRERRISDCKIGLGQARVRPGHPR